MGTEQAKEIRSAEKGAAPGFMRKTYMVNMDLANKIDAIVFWDRTTLKDTLFEMQSNFVKEWESKNGKVKLPKKK